MVEFYELLQQISPAQGAGHWNLWPTAPKLRWQLGLGDWYLKCGGGGWVLQDLALHLCDLMLSPGRQCQDGGAWRYRRPPYTFTHTHTHQNWMQNPFRYSDDWRWPPCFSEGRMKWQRRKRKATNIYWLANTVLSNFGFTILSKENFTFFKKYIILLLLFKIFKKILIEQQ